MRHREDAAPVWAEEAEQAVLGALLLDGAAISDARQFVSAEDFYVDGHRVLFRAMCDLAARGDALDPLTLCEVLQRAGTLEDAGGKDFIGFLIDVVPTASNVGYHAGIVKRHAQRRAVVELLTRGAQRVRDGTLSAEEAARQISADLLPIAVDGDTGKGFREVTAATWEEMIAETLARGEAARSGVTSGVTFGFRDYDRHMGGHQPGELVIPGAGPKVGKSVFALSALRHHVGRGQEGAMISAEMPTSSCLHIMASAGASIPGAKWAPGRISAAEARRAADYAEGLTRTGRLHINEVPFPELGNVLAEIQALKAKRPALSFVVVDYLQLVSKRMDGPRGDEELGEICKGLKGIALRCELVILAPAQLNFKETDRRADGRPKLHDFQGGSGFAQTADFPLLLWRPYLHNPIADERESWIIAERSRRTAPFDVRLRWEGEYRRVIDWTDDSRPRAA